MTLPCAFLHPVFCFAPPQAFLGKNFFWKTQLNSQDMELFQFLRIRTKRSWNIFKMRHKHSTDIYNLRRQQNLQMNKRSFSALNSGESVDRVAFDWVNVLKFYNAGISLQIDNWVSIDSIFFYKGWYQRPAFFYKLFNLKYMRRFLWSIF